MGVARPVPAVISAVQQLVVEGVRERLFGLLVDADNALFELAARCNHDEDRRRCFDLARLLRKERQRFIEQFCRAMNRSDQLWARREFRAYVDDANWQHARRLGHNVRAHFSPLLGALAGEVERVLEVRVDDPDALPISPTCVGAAFLESRTQIAALHPEIEPYLDRLFVRYVVDRLGRLYGDALTILSEAP